MRCYSHLSDDEREQIGLAKAVGHSIGAIAKAIGRPRSTVSRELSRNKLPSGRYSPLHAAGAYRLRRRREARIERDRALRTFVVDRLAEGWTPEQISGWLKGGNEPRLRAVGCETIYAFIYRAAQQAEQLWRYLTRHHKRRCRLFRAPAGRSGDRMGPPGDRDQSEFRACARRPRRSACIDQGCGGRRRSPTFHCALQLKEHRGTDEVWGHTTSIRRSARACNL